MSLKRNILVNYISQLYVTAVGIIVVPLYVLYMGAEAYGLVGFFFMLQAWFNLLDMGLTPTMARETARYNGGAINSLEYRQLTRALEGVFFLTALAGCLLLFFSAKWIALGWLNLNRLEISEIISSIQLIAIIIALRWMCGLYRGIITGSERIVWLSSFNSLVATGRFLLVLPVLVYFSATPLAFFGFQLFIAIAEIIGLAWMAYRLLPTIDAVRHIRWKWSALKPIIKFSLSIGFTSSVWIMVTQIDKLVLSKILPLADYGYFTVAVLVASGIMVMSGPISGAIMPRLTRLEAEGQHNEVIAIYRHSTQLVTIIATPVTLVLAFFPEKVLWAWTGDTMLVEKASLVLSLYAAGYGVLAIAAFPFYLQYAKGDLKLHLIGNGITLFTLIPTVIWAAANYGIDGPGWAWFATHSIYLLLWVPLIHQRFAPEMHWSWLSRDVIFPIVVPFFSTLLISQLIDWPNNRLLVFVQLAAIAIFLFFMTLPFASRLDIRGQFIK